MRTLLKPWVLGVALVLSPVLVMGAEGQAKQYPACTTKPTEGDVAGAKGAFQAGQASFNEADYARAITYWEDAFRRDCTAKALLLNLARAYELNGQKEQAIVALQTYIKRNPNSSQLDQLQRRIDVLKKEVAAEASAKASASAPTVQPSATPAPTASSTGAYSKPVPAPPAKGERSRPIYPLFVAGAGGVLAIVGGALWIKANGDVSNFEKQCPNRVCPANLKNQQQVKNDGNSAVSRQRLWGGVAIAGLVIGAGGVAWYFLQPHGSTGGQAMRRKSKPEFSPIVGPGFAGLSMSGAF